MSQFSHQVVLQKGSNQYRKETLMIKSLLDSFSESAYFVDTKFHLQYFNKGFELCFELRYEKKPILEQSIFEQLNDGSFVHELKRNISEAALGNPVHFIFKDQDEMIEFRIRPIHESEKLLGFAIVNHNLKEMRHYEKTLQQQYNRLKIVNDELDRFVYSASHDIRAPLMSIKGLLNIMRAEKDRSAFNGYLDHIDKSVNRLDNFIKEIINYSRNERLEVKYDLINFSEIVQESIDNLKFLENVEKVKSIVEIQAWHPFYSDRSRIVVIFNNIISNAVQYRNALEESFVKISIVCDANTAILAFSDNGIGIDASHLDKLFTMFYRAHHHSKGSGLGLYNVKNAVLKLNGSIEVGSTIRKGTTFKIVLPNLFNNEQGTETQPGID